MNGSGIRPMEMAKPTIDMCEDYLVIYDKKGTQIYIDDFAGLVSNIETTMTIEQVSIAALGNGCGVNGRSIQFVSCSV